MKLIDTKIEDLKIIKTKIYKDNRGFLKEVFRKNIFKKIDFPFDIMTFSKKNVLRGLHIQNINSQAKIITVSQGKIFDVAVDLRAKSKTYGKFFSLVMSEKNDFSFYIPKGFAHGFLCLSEKCVINYKCSQYRHEKSERTIKWNDKFLNINWPIKKPILSMKDKKGITFNDYIISTKL